MTGLTILDDTYLPLLSLPDTTAGTVNGEGTDVSVSSGIGGDYDIIPDKVKVTMLLEAAADIRGLERDLREVEIMKGKDVDGAGDLGGECGPHRTYECGMKPIADSFRSITIETRIGRSIKDFAGERERYG